MTKSSFTRHFFQINLMKNRDTFQNDNYVIDGLNKSNEEIFKPPWSKNTTLIRP